MKTFFAKDVAEIFYGAKRVCTAGGRVYTNKNAFNDLIEAQVRGVPEETSRQRQSVIEDLKSLFDDDHGARARVPQHREFFSVTAGSRIGAFS
jgi:hypothetical protein